MAEELVLTFPRRLLDEIGSFQGLRTDIAPYVPRILEAQNTRYVPRSLAEDDPSLKQIIPYVLVRRGDTLLHYVRGKGSGEKRLVARARSGSAARNHRADLFGVADYYETSSGAPRGAIDADLTTRIVALINDDSTPVGQVHFGVVHECQHGDQHVSRGEPCITDLRFLTMDQLRERRDAMETWSQLSLDFVLANPAFMGR
jgi:predicted NUDIX family phosphoesterase